MMNLMNNVRTNPTFAAIFYFVLTWVGFPLAAFVSSQVHGVSLATAAGSLYLISTFALGSLAAAVSAFFSTRDSRV